MAGLKPLTKCLIKRKIVCGSPENNPKFRATDFWKKTAWTEGLFVSFRMPFCITAYLKGSYIPDVLNWPRTRPPPHTRRLSQTPLTCQPTLLQSLLHRSPEEMGQYPKTIMNPKISRYGFFTFQAPRRWTKCAFLSTYLKKKKLSSFQPKEK